MKRLVLAGAGHAHLQVLQAIAGWDRRDLEVVMVSPQSHQLYSGMIPGWLAGHYTLGQCAIPLEPLVLASGTRHVKDYLVGLNAAGRTLRLEASGALDYDLLSLDIGGTTDLSWLAASGAALLPVRPLEHFVARSIRLLETFRLRGQASMAVVGGGAAGVELALAMAARLDRDLGGDNRRIALFAGQSLLSGHGRSTVGRARRTLAARGIELIEERVAGSEAGLLLPDGREFVLDCVFAATGTRAPEWLAASGLQRADDGFVAIGRDHRSISHPEVLAAGDIATQLDSPRPKSGVSAVRAGPILAENLRRALAGEPLLMPTQRSRSLYIIANGLGGAIASWGSLSAQGRWAWHWKDQIDRRFIARFSPRAGPALALEP